MTEDGGIDRQKLLDEIVGGGALPSEHAPASPLPAPAGPDPGRAAPPWPAEALAPTQEPAAKPFDSGFLDSGPHAQARPVDASPVRPFDFAPGDPVGRVAAPRDRPAVMSPAKILSYRREIAAIVLVFVGVVWLAVGVAVLRAVPSLLGAACLLSGLILQARGNRS